jgi:ArsR family transcriptional regulator
MIYSLPAVQSRELEANLKCLQDCVQAHPIFKADLRRLAKLKPKMDWLNEFGECGTNRRGRTRRTAKGDSCSKC